MATNTKRWSARAGRRGLLAMPIACVAALLGTTAIPAWGEQIDLGMPDVTLRFDNTIKYGNILRVGSPSNALLADANQDDGDRNFAAGSLASNRLDLLSEMDVSYLGQYGARISTAAYYDDVYNQSNANNSPATTNQYGTAYNNFTQATRNLAGRNFQLLDAFIYTTGDADNHSYTMRLGQHSVQYGETLFFGSNGIAGAQSPIDIFKLLAVPDTQFKELILPQPQFSFELQLSSTLTLGGYYQFHWQPDRLPPVGSYFSDTDVLQQGAERILLGPPIIPGGGATAFWRIDDERAHQSGQGGMELRWSPGNGQYQYGLYLAQFNAKDPEVYVMAGQAVDVPLGRVGEYKLVYNSGIRTVGVSATTTIGDTNLAGEMSFRNNMPLVSPGVTVPFGANPNSNLSPIGNTFHANANFITTLPRTPVWQGASLIGELAYNRLLAITANPGALDPNATRDALVTRFVFTPSYYQVVHGLDVSFPIGLGYNPYGRSSVISVFNGGSSNGGDFTVGITGLYRQVWNTSLSFTHYIGAARTSLVPANAAIQYFSFGQSLADRDFLAFSISRTF